MNQEVLKKTIKDMEKQIKEQQEIRDRLKKLIEPEITYLKGSDIWKDLELNGTTIDGAIISEFKIEPAQKYYPPKVIDLKEYFPLDWNKKIVEINYTDGTQFSDYDKEVCNG